MDKPISISAKCSTYGRVAFLEESLESFIRQEYEGEYELVIVNDYPLQKLKYDHPKVRIYNLDKPFDTLGEKENFIISLCKYDTIAVWDDDDLALPNHLKNINEFFPEHDLLRWNVGIFFKTLSSIKIKNLGNSGIVFSKSIWEKVGGYPLINGGFDMKFTKKIFRNGGKFVSANPPKEKASWIYVWGGRGLHASSGGDNLALNHAAHIERLRIKGKIPVGEIKLNPNWKQDYIKKLADFCKL